MEISISSTSRALQAAKEGEEGIVKEFIEQEAQKIAPPLNPIIYDILSSASANNHMSIVEMILSLGINVDGLDHKKETAFYRACRSRLTDDRIIKFLLGQGADVNKLVKGRTPLATACHHGRLDLVKLLIQKGACVYQKTSAGYTPLSIAVYQTHVELCSLLLKNGAPVDDTTQSGFSSLMISACQGNLEISDILLGAGANLKKKNDLGFTPLMLAAENGYVQLVQLLLSINVDCLNDCNNRGFTPLMIAAHKGHLDTVKLLLSLMPSWHTSVLPALMLAVNNNHSLIVEYLLAQKKIPLDQTYQGVAALHLSAQNGNLELTKLFVRHGAKVDQRTSTGRTPLMLASSYGHSPVVKLLVAHGAALELEMDGEIGHSALYFALTQGHSEVVKILVQAGASVTNTTKDIAEALGYADIFYALKQAESNPHNNKFELPGFAILNDSTTSKTSSINEIVSHPLTSSDLESNLNKFEATKLEGQQGIRVDEVLNNTNTFHTSPSESKLDVTQRQEKDANLVGVCSDLPCGEGGAPAPHVDSVRQATASASSVNPHCSAVVDFKGEEEILRANVDATGSDKQTDQRQTQLPLTEMQKECTGAVLPLLLPKKEKEKEAAETTATSVSNITHPTGAVAKCTSSSSLSEDGQANSNTQNSAVMQHSLSTPATLSEVIQALSRREHQNQPVVVYLVDARTINITDAETVGLGPVNITHHNKKEPDESDPDADGEEGGDG